MQQQVTTRAKFRNMSIISTLPQNSKVSEEQNTRIHDYLDDKLQTDADLDNIDSLLRNVLEQQGLLRQQVKKSLIMKRLADFDQAG